MTPDELHTTLIVIKWLAILVIAFIAAYIPMKGIDND